MINYINHFWYRTFCCTFKYNVNIKEKNYQHKRNKIYPKQNIMPNYHCILYINKEKFTPKTFCFFFATFLHLFHNRNNNHQLEYYKTIHSIA